MDDLLQLAALLTTLCAPPDMSRSAPFATAGVATAMNATVLHATPSMLCARHSIVPATPSAVVATRSTRFISATELQADSWTGEDKFRHAAASWAAMVFTYAAARAVHDDSDTALAVAVPVTAAAGIAKEIVDRRRGGPFSFRDLAADALGAGAAWLFLREVR